MLGVCVICIMCARKPYRRSRAARAGGILYHRLDKIGVFTWSQPHHAPPLSCQAMTWWSAGHRRPQVKVETELWPATQQRLHPRPTAPPFRHWVNSASGVSSRVPFSRRGSSDNARRIVPQEAAEDFRGPRCVWHRCREVA